LGGHQLLGEERIAVRPRHDGVDLCGRSGVTEDRGQHLGEFVLFQAGEVDALHGFAAVQFGQEGPQRMAVAKIPRRLRRRNLRRRR
jgi:hypothetical protein